MLITGAGVFVNNVLAAGVHAEPDELNANGSRGNRVVNDVRFVDAAHYDYHLRPSSPAIGAGADLGAAAGFSVCGRATYLRRRSASLRARRRVRSTTARFRPSRKTHRYSFGFGTAIQ